MSTPFIALYPTDFLADVGHLGNTELGIYWRLLLVYYRDGRPLPFDTDRLRRLAMTFSPEECRALEAVVSEFFVLSAEPDGTRVWRHRRADKEMERAANYLEGKRRGAEKARAKLAAKRAGAPLVPDVPDIKADAALISDQISGGEPEPEPEPEPEKDSVADATGGKPPAVDTADVIFTYGVPMLVQGGTAEKQARSFLGRLRRLHGDDKVIDALRSCYREKPIQPLEWLGAALAPPAVKAARRSGPQEFDTEARNRAAKALLGFD